MGRRATTRAGYLAAGYLSLVAVLLSSGCRLGPSYEVARLDVMRVGWDTLQVALAFERHQVGRTETASPESLAVYAFDAAYDTLYAGADLRFAVPDRRLGDGERVMVEVCGLFDADRVCEQRGVLASPKRIRAEHELTYPDDEAFAKGAYTLRLTVERQRAAAAGAGAAAWEDITAERMPARLVGYVESQPADQVSVPISRPEGRFDLSTAAGYQAFKFLLDSRMLAEQETTVRFEIYAPLGRDEVKVASVPKQIRTKSTDERAADVSAFVEQAAEQLVERLGISWEGDDVTVYVNDWSFNKLDRTYAVEVEMTWAQRRLFRTLRYQLAGVLSVSERGETASFEVGRSNRRAENRWEDRSERQEVPLQPLLPAEDWQEAQADEVPGASDAVPQAEDEV